MHNQLITANSKGIQYKTPTHQQNTKHTGQVNQLCKLLASYM